MLMDVPCTALDLGQAMPCGPGKTPASSPRLHRIQAMYTHILVPVDGSPTSDRGLDEAVKLARLTGGRLRLVHVVDQLVASSRTSLPVAVTVTPESAWPSVLCNDESAAADKAWPSAGRASARSRNTNRETCTVSASAAAATVAMDACVLAAEAPNANSSAASVASMIAVFRPKQIVRISFNGSPW